MDWLDSQPDGKEKQNYVAIDRKGGSLSGTLRDIEGFSNFCVVCSLSGKSIIKENISYF